MVEEDSTEEYIMAYYFAKHLGSKDLSAVILDDAKKYHVSLDLKKTEK